MNFHRSKTQTILARVWIIGSVSAFTACSPVLTRRFDQLITAAPAASTPSIGVFVLDTPSTSNPPFVLGLSPEGQRAYVGAIKSLAKTPPDFTKLLNWSGVDAQGGVIDRTVLRKRIVLSVDSDAGSKRADRLERLRVTLDCSPNLEFSGWTLFTTQFGEVDLGKISLTQKTSFSAGLDPNLAGSVSGGASLKIAADRELKEELTLRQRFIKLSGILSRSSATFVQEGTPGIDLAGNAAADVILRLNADNIPMTVHAFKDLYGAAGLNPGAKVTFQKFVLRRPADDAGRELTVGGRYLKRIVPWNARTVIEGTTGSDMRTTT